MLYTLQTDLRMLQDILLDITRWYGGDEPPCDGSGKIFPLGELHRCRRQRFCKRLKTLERTYRQKRGSSQGRREIIVPLFVHGRMESRTVGECVLSYPVEYIPSFTYSTSYI